MNWLLRLYPAQWRERYGEEFGAVLASQRVSVGLVVDVIGGAIDAHLHPQFHTQTQNSNTSYSQREDTMTLAMLQRCSVGGPKLSPSDRRIASRATILSALGLAAVSLVLTKIYHGAPAVQALLYASAPVLSIVHGQTAYLRKRPWQTQALVLGAGISGMYLFMLAVCLIANRL